MNIDFTTTEIVLEIHVFERTYCKPKEKPPKTALISFSIGDIVRPWIENNEQFERIFGPSFVIKEIQELSRGVRDVLDEKGNRYTSGSIQLGLTEAVKKRALDMVGERYKPFRSIPYSVICHPFVSITDDIIENSQ